MNVDLYWIYYLLTFWTMGYPTYEVQYYQPGVRSDQGQAPPALEFSLLCNARRAVFRYAQPQFSAASVLSREDINSPGQSEDAPAVWLAKDLLSGRQLQQVRSIQGTNYLIEESAHPMQWQIDTVQRELGGMRVLSARCSYRGRTYTAWFAPDLPIGQGPWKLGGLPGLILEAYDEEREVVFLFRALRYRGAQVVPLPEMAGRRIDGVTYREVNRRELGQYIHLIESKLKEQHIDIDFDLEVNWYPGWECPE